MFFKFVLSEERKTAEQFKSVRENIALEQKNNPKMFSPFFFFLN